MYIKETYIPTTIEYYLNLSDVEMKSKGTNLMFESNFKPIPRYAGDATKKSKSV